MYAQKITVEIPWGIADILPGASMEREIRRYLAVKYYQDESLTLGKAAELAGMNRMEFELFLAGNEIPVSLLNYEDIRADLERMKTLTAPAR
jgi:predicted HTH domain antitoxin